ncbi:MFS transporter [Brenneria goodwinii]|uniref:MFS transporter n=1 Tax=Brenneria goodwinii TaxID=1109412 RepID=UPI000EF2519E|nr:MFS transporter [Brenneria goodwinii]MCG8157311.1 MFS transporter [Brenneria goodwinii]MCG8163366.1 MFS transporter [Brenneria goodwinii]MCG8165125.1 MFS transporter [Brenneria goodwinii]MCG8170907.1 MFS transporter [Brenneria goodwinii]MCG8175892.1 MFS transporter [Brenneria goodwinii]
MWWRIALLALGAFAMGTDGFIVAGVLSDISHQFDIDVAAGGQLVTVFAVVYALSSPLIASLCATWPRRRLLLLAMGIFIVANLFAALADSFTQLLAARVIAAIASAAYTPCASVCAASMVAPHQRGKALSMVMGGITVATIIGVPLGTWLGHYGGFRLAFGFVAVLGLVAIMGLALWLPALRMPSDIDFKERVQSLLIPGVPGILAVTALAMTAGFTVYTYLGPLLASTLHADENTLGMVLMVFGIAGTLGNMLSGWLVDRWGSRRTVAFSLMGVTLILAVLPALAVTLPGALMGICLWNAMGWLLLPAQQHRLISEFPRVGQLLISINASAMYLGIGMAGAWGGVVLRLGEAWMLGPAAAGVAFVALALHGATSGYKRPRLSD